LFLFYFQHPNSQTFTGRSNLITTAGPCTNPAGRLIPPDKPIYKPFSSPKISIANWIEAHPTGLCTAITLLAALLRLYQVGERSVWFDEAIELLIARAPFAEIQKTSYEWFYGDPPLYSWLLHIILKLGESEWVWRMPSVLVGTFGVLAAYHLFRLWVDVPTALLSQTMLAVSPAQVYYSQEVNQYAFMVFFAIVILWAFQRTLQCPSIRRMLIFSTLSIFGLFTHYGLLWMIVGLFFTVPLKMKVSSWYKWWPTILSLGLSFSGLFLFVIRPQLQVMRKIFPSPSKQWFISSAEIKSLGHQLWATAHLFTDYRDLGAGPHSLITWLFILFFSLGLIIALTKPNWRTLPWLLLFLLLISYMAHRLGFYFWGARYLLYLSPLFYLFCSIGLVALAHRGFAFKFLPVVALCLLLYNERFVGWPNQDTGEHLRPVVRQVQAKARPEEGIYVYYGAKPAFLVYYSGTRNRVHYGKWFREKPLNEKLADIEPFMTLWPHWWLVASHLYSGEVEALLKALDQRCRRNETISQSNALAVRFDCER